ncbi:MAG: hypothetical protein ACFFD4_12435 [Candidatus Odinarchaeota archaeon]
MADNVRRLAGDTKVNVTNTRELVDNIQYQIMVNADKIARSIDSVVAVAEETAASSEKAPAASEEQITTMEEMSVTAQELTQLTEELNASIARFMINESKIFQTLTTRVVAGPPHQGQVAAIAENAWKAWNFPVDKTTAEEEKNRNRETSLTAPRKKAVRTRFFFYFSSCAGQKN